MTTAEQSAIYAARLRDASWVLAPSTLAWLARCHRVDVRRLPVPSAATLRARVAAHAAAERARGVRVRSG